MRAPFHLSLLVAGLVLATAAAADIPPPVPGEGSAAPAAGMEGAAATATTDAANPAAVDLNLPELDPAQWFDGKQGGTFGDKTVTILPKNNRVAVAGFRVVFINYNKVRAMTRGSYLPGRDTGTAHAKMEVSLQGVDDATLQAITDAAYARFMEQLRATGREVVPMEQMASFYAAAKTSPMPYRKEINLGGSKRTGAGFAPTGMPLWFTNWEGWGDQGMSQTNIKQLGILSHAIGAIVIAPVIEVDFAQMQSSGNRSGLVARTAEVGATLAMSVRTFSTHVIRADEVRYGGIVSKGEQGDLALVSPIDTDVEFATMAKVEERSGGVMSVFNVLGSNSRGSVHEARTTNEAYSAAAGAVLAQATATFAKLFANHPATVASAQ